MTKGTISISYIDELAIFIEKDKQKYHTYQLIIKQIELYENQNHNDILETLLKALHLVGSVMGNDNLISARIYLNLGKTCLNLNKYDEAIDYLNKSEKIVLRYGKLYEDVLNQIDETLSKVCEIGKRRSG